MTSEAANTSLRGDPYLWFLLAGVPGRFRRLILEDFHGSRFNQATCAEAADILEGGAYVDWVKATLIGVLGGALLAVTTALHGIGRDVEQAIILGLIMWTPVYIIVVGIAQQILRRTADAARRPVTARTKTLSTLRLAPWIAAVIAALIGVLGS